MLTEWHIGHRDVSTVMDWIEIHHCELCTVQWYA